MLEGAERRASMCQDFYQTFYLRERYIVSVSSNFLTQISHGTRTKCRKTRAMQRDFTIVDSLALRAVRVKPISCALRACFLGHYRMTRMSQSASSCGLASWMRPQQLRHFYGSKCSFAKIAIPCTIYPSLNLPRFYVWQPISVVLRTRFFDLHCCNILLWRISSIPL